MISRPNLVMTFTWVSGLRNLRNNFRIKGKRWGITQRSSFLMIMIVLKPNEYPIWRLNWQQSAEDWRWKDCLRFSERIPEKTWSFDQWPAESSNSAFRSRLPSSKLSPGRQLTGEGFIKDWQEKEDQLQALSALASGTDARFARFEPDD